MSFEKAMHFFVNLPLSFVPGSPEFLNIMLERSIAPELGIDAVANEGLSPGWHESVSIQLQEAGLAPGMHLPFFDLHPGSLDSHILQGTRARLLDVISVATIYSPRHLVGHAAYDRTQHRRHYRRWLERSVRTWDELLEAWPDAPPLFLENTHEKDPEPLADLVGELRARGRDVGVCLDIGHWFAFALGHERRDFGRWLDSLGPFVRHLHLHDNDGSGDQHRGLGKGNIPWDEVLPALAELGQPLTATLEPHDIPTFEVSSAFVADRQDLFPGHVFPGGGER